MVDDDFELSGDAPEEKKKIVRPNYTQAFEQFWNAYPRKQSKYPAFKAWKNHVDESDRNSVLAIVQNLEKRKRLGYWSNDRSKIPHATTFINQHRWEDEDWEDEIKTRKDGKPNSGMRTYKPIEDTGVRLHHWQSMMNLLTLSYIRACGGVSDAVLEILIRTKNEVFEEIIESANEEVDNAKDKSAARAEMAWLFADMMLSRFDSFTGRSLKERILTERRVAA